MPTRILTGTSIKGSPTPSEPPPMGSAVCAPLRTFSLAPFVLIPVRGCCRGRPPLSLHRLQHGQVHSRLAATDLPGKAPTHALWLLFRDYTFVWLCWLATLAGLLRHNRFPLQVSLVEVPVPFPLNASDTVVTAVREALAETAAAGTN
eukprot:473311-Pyramimonas_sp.AAC.1